jgi:hypothetical protein
LRLFRSTRYRSSGFSDEHEASIDAVESGTRRRSKDGIASESSRKQGGSARGASAHHSSSISSSSTTHGAALVCRRVLLVIFVLLVFILSSKYTLRPFDRAAKLDVTIPAFPDTKSELAHFYGPNVEENANKGRFLEILTWWQAFSSKHNVDYALGCGITTSLVLEI